MKVLVLHKRFILPLIVFLLVASVSSFAQRRGGNLLDATEKHDFGVFAGVATYIGDFNETNFLYKPNVLVGLLYRYNINPYFSLRAQAGQARVEGSSRDYYGNLPGFPAGGGITFKRSMIMLDGAVEFNFLPYSSTDKKRQNIFSPYVALGVGMNFMGSNSYNNNPQLDIAANIYPELYGKPGKTFSQTVVFEAPISFGVKVSPIRRFTLAGEWTFKKMFYDDIDGFTNRGGSSFSLINDDWVSTITLSLTYRFASNWKCDAYQKRTGNEKLKGFKNKTYKVNVSQSATKDTKKNSNVKKLKGRSENDSNKIKKKQK